MAGSKKKFILLVLVVILAMAAFVAVCFLTEQKTPVSDLLPMEKLRYCKREIILFCMGNDYKKTCDQYQLDPPWSMAFADALTKQAWVKLHISLPPPEPPNYEGRGKLLFVLSAAPDVEQYLSDKKYPLTISCKEIPEMFVVLPGKLEAPAGKYKLQMSLPECKVFQTVDIDLQKDKTLEVQVSAIPLDGTVQVNCNVKSFQIWNGREWLTADEVAIDSLQFVDVTVRADGYRNYTETVRLLPNQTKVLNVVLQKLPDNANGNIDEVNKANLEEAEAEYQSKNYTMAKKHYEIEAAKGNRIAQFKLGVMFENGHGLWMADKKEAYRYYLAAAKQNYGKAIFKVGYFHENGIGGVPENKLEALKWYRLGAELENDQCLNKIAEFYESGKGGVAVDVNMAISYYKRGADKRNSDAQFSLGRIYEHKMMSATIQKDKDQFRQMARDWYEKAARQGMLEAKERMNRL